MTTTELKKLLFSMILKTPIWLVHLAANQSSVNEHTYLLLLVLVILGLVQLLLTGN